MKKNIILIAVILQSMIISCQGFSGFGAKVNDVTSFKGLQADVDDYNSTMTAVSNSARTAGSILEEITPVSEYQIGQAAKTKLLESYSIRNDNADLAEYLNRICMVIAVKSGQPDIFNGYHVKILDSNEQKAFAIPGGHILLTRGLINTAKSEEDLAVIIAREIAHLQLKHIVNMLRTRLGNSRITDVLQSDISDGSNSIENITAIIIDTAADTVLELLKSGYSNNQTLAAENYSKTLLGNAGYTASSSQAETSVKAERFSAAMRAIRQ